MGVRKNHKTKIGDSSSFLIETPVFLVNSPPLSTNHIFMKILHNPRCRKSREGLQILQDSGTDFEVVEYLKTPLSKNEIEALLAKLKIEAIDLVRKNEQEWKDNFKGKDLDHDQIVAAMAGYPKLIERPIVIGDDQAVIGRPPENIYKLING